MNGKRMLENFFLLFEIIIENCSKGFSYVRHLVKFQTHEIV
jgi:hypothetical protein